MPEPDERLAPAPPEVTPAPEAEGLPSGWRAVVPDLRPLRRHRDYRLLTLGQSVSLLGSMVTYVAVPYQVYRLTHSSLAVGLIGVVQMAAILSLAFLGGALADAADRRRLVRLAETGQLGCSLALGGRAAQPPAGGRGPPLRPEPARADRHLSRRHGGHVLRDADGPLPRPGRALRRVGGPRGALRR
ncbi:MAG TPA: MFS transporter, partial [Acidimicrobiia bacterium]|nr:MFS transporter [Acidimicrobiia bacterium]